MAVAALRALDALLDMIPSPETALCLDGIGIDYHLFHHRTRSLWSHLFGGRREQERPQERGFAFGVLDGVSLSLASGDRLAIIGANGAGRTTLALVLAGILHPVRGKREALGCVYPVIAGGAAPHPDATIGDLGAYEAIRRGRTILDGLRWAKDAIAFSELSLSLDALVADLPSEEAGRIRLALGLQTGSDIYILDDTLSSLSPLFFAKLAAAFRDPQRSESILVACERTESALYGICQEVVYLKDGRLSGRVPLEVSRAVDPAL